jgi:hypothetical protein
VNQSPKANDDLAAPPPYSAVDNMASPSAPPAQYMSPYPANTADVIRNSEFDNYGSISPSPVDQTGSSARTVAPPPRNPRKITVSLKFPNS